MKSIRELIFKVDSRLKLASYFLLIIIVFLPIHNTGYLFLFSILLIISILIKTSSKKYLYLFFNTLFIYLFIQFFNIFFVTSDPLEWGILFTIGNIDLYWYSIYVSLSLASRFMLLFFSALVFSSIIKIDEMAYSINFFLKPLKYIKIPSEDLAIIITIAIRFLPILKEELESVYLLNKSKKFISRTLFFKLKIYSLSLNTIVNSIFDKADNLSIAMENRYFIPGNQRTFYEFHKISIKDFVYLFIILIIFISFIIFAIDLNLIPRFLDPTLKL